jgi:hypothetical protein
MGEFPSDDGYPMVRGINGDNPRSHCGSLLLGYVYGTCSQYGWKRLDITLNDYVE